MNMATSWNLQHYYNSMLCVLVDDSEIASSSIFDQGAVLEKAYCCYVKGGERVLATFVVIGILVTEVVPPVLLTWPTS